jgi:hypothetical protein
MSTSTTVDDVERDIRNICDIIEGLLEDLRRMIDDIRTAAEKKGQLDPRKVDNATRRLSTLEGSIPGKLQVKLVAQWKGRRGDLKKAKGLTDPDERLKVLAKVRKRVDCCIEIAHGVVS